jgi:hypothetical protein
MIIGLLGIAATHRDILSQPHYIPERYIINLIDMGRPKASLDVSHEDDRDIPSITRH